MPYMSLCFWYITPTPHSHMTAHKLFCVNKMENRRKLALYEFGLLLHLLFIRIVNSVYINI